MSRIGKLPIQVPAGVDVTIDGRTVGNGKAGAIWRRIFDEFQAFKKRESK